MSAQTVLSRKSSPVLEPDPSAQLWRRLDAAPPAAQLPLASPGRCLVPDGLHVVCEAVSISARGLKIVCEASADPGDAVAANFRNLGEINGVVESRGEGWFVMAVREPPERLAILAERLLWSVRQHREGLTDRRMSPRFEQNRRRATLKTLDGRETVGEWLDLSSTGAAVRLGAAAGSFRVGQDVVLDGRPARVRRHFPGGIGVEFDEPREVEG